VAAFRDPYAVLGVAPDASDAELRASYRRLVQLHHPDHNGGSTESAKRFEEVQEAYAEARRLRKSGGARTPPPDPNLESRLAEMERRLREANLARERARRAAREAAAAARETAAAAGEGRRASDEDLGYVTTDDSFMKIFSDARDQLFGAASEARDEAREHRVADRAADALEDIAARLRGEDPARPPGRAGSSSEDRS
jgi:DnaJ-class molecular chaperone